MLSLHKFRKHIFGHSNLKLYNASIAHKHQMKVDNIYSDMHISQMCRTISSVCGKYSLRRDPAMRRYNAEYRAVCSLINRSNFQNTWLSNHYTNFRKSFHTSSSTAQNSNTPKDPIDMGQPKDPKNPKDMIFKMVFWSIIAYFSFYFLALLSPQDRVGHPQQNVTWSDFIKEMLMKGEVEEVIVRPELEIITVVLAEGAVIKGKKVRNRYYQLEFGDPERFESKLRHTEELLGIKKGIPISYERSGEVLGRIITTLIILLILFILRHRAKSMGEAYFKGMDGFKSMGKAEFTLIDSKAGQGKGVKFNDVAGLKEAKVEVMEFVDYLKNPDFYQQLGAKVPKGALLLGPPGCGKTLLAKAVATEAGVPFLSMNGSEFIEMIGGLGAARVRDLFKQAGKLSPCIIYIDEIDAIGKERAQGGMSSLGGGEEEQTLNQLLVEMDGMATREAILVLASTNRAEVLDKALLRPGRFDRHILIDLPNLIERKEIFEYHLGNIKLARKPSVFSRRMASLTPGFSGADIANVCNEAALHAARDLKGSVEHEDLEYAIERTLGGVEKRNHAMSQQEKQIVAYHESGHALVGWLLEHTDALLKVTIVPRTNMALGFAQYSPRDQKLYSKEELFDQMCMALGGRVAEALTFNRITTGAQNDLQKVTKIAYAQVEQFGMCDSVGLVSFDQPEMGVSPYSRSLRNLMDHEARCLTDRAYYRTEDLLKQNLHKLKKIAEALLVKETLNYTDVKDLIGPPTHEKKRFIDPAEFEMSLENRGPSRTENKTDEAKDDTTNVQESPKTTI